MKKSKLHLMSWLLLLASILLISCKKDEPNQKKETPRNPEVVAQEQELLKLLGEDEGIAFASGMKVGDTISMAIRAEGELEFKGMKPSEYPSRYPDVKAWVCYTITDPNVVIKGNVIGFNIHEAPLTAFVASQAPNFRNFNMFSCPNITDLDFSHCKGLVFIRTGNLDNLTRITLPTEPILKNLYLWTSPKLEQLNLSKATELKFLDLSGTSLKELDLTHCNKLIELYLDSPSTPIPDISHLKLEALSLRNKNLTSLDVSMLPATLIYLNLKNNKLQGSLDLSLLKRLNVLSIADNQLSTLKLHHVPAQLYAQNNLLTSIEVAEAENKYYEEDWYDGKEQRWYPCLFVNLTFNKMSEEAITQFLDKLFTNEIPNKLNGLFLVATRENENAEYSFGENAFTPQHLEQIDAKGWIPVGYTKSTGKLNTINSAINTAELPTPMMSQGYPSLELMRENLLDASNESDARAFTPHL
ncbi:hypothetical protein [uncultured Porphyromonas sp.]|uniref:hypothetical protein n=1 Tax=uncultured Porphyromonas sp. TaxID=159274 RepID=UPI0025D0F333|nr:hypothetical protein [uncultured Porphyromonas sp.]